MYPKKMKVEVTYLKQLRSESGARRVRIRAARARVIELGINDTVLNFILGIKGARHER